MKQRIISLDVGDKRVGVASCYINSNIVTPIGIYQRTNSLAEKIILEMLAKGDIELVIVGLPLSRDGSENDQCLKVKAFVRRVIRRNEASSNFVKVVFVDEFASSLESYERLQEIESNGANFKTSRRNHIDDVAACLILERYLENEK